MLNKSIRLNLHPASFRNKFPDLPTANIVEIYQKLTGNYHAKVSGKATLVKCCLHDDSTPSMALYPSTSSYYCWGCSKHGNIFNLVEEVLRCSFKEALKFVEDNK